jgi:hypothetical protein
MTLEGEQPVRILAFWGGTFADYFKEVVLENSRFEVDHVADDLPADMARELRGKLKSGAFDLVIGGTRSVSPSLNGWLPAVAEAGIPLAALDLLEHSHVQPEDFDLLKASTLYFKLNLYCWARRSLMPLETFFGMRRVTAQTPKLRPLTWGISPRAIPASVRPMQERDIDLCLIGPSRGLSARCEGLKEQCRVFTAPGELPTAEYAAVLQHSKLVVCAENGGCESPRDYEAAAAGAVPLVNWPAAQNHLPLLPEKQAIYFSSIGSDFERMVLRALGDMGKLERIAASARAFTVERKQRAEVGAWIVEETLAAKKALSS